MDYPTTDEGEPDHEQAVEQMLPRNPTLFNPVHIGNEREISTISGVDTEVGSAEVSERHNPGRKYEVQLQDLWGEWVSGELRIYKKTFVDAEKIPDNHSVEETIDQLTKQLRTFITLERDRELSSRKSELHTNPVGAIEDALRLLSGLGENPDDIVLPDDQDALGITVGVQGDLENDDADADGEDGETEPNIEEVVNCIQNTLDASPEVDTDTKQKAVAKFAQFLFEGVEDIETGELLTWALKDAGVPREDVMAIVDNCI